MSNDTLRILQISDIHLFADEKRSLLGVNTLESFQAVMALVKAEKDVNLIILSGDLSQDGSDVAYKRIASLMEGLNVPVYYLPGNHDNVAMMAQVLPRQIISNHKHIVLKDWHIILLNSQKPGAVEGYLDESELNYLQHCLQAYPEHRAIIVFHHHPVKVGSKWLDNLGLTNADTFWNIISHYPRVHTVLYGHVHQVKEELVGNIHCLSAPACCFQFKCQNEFALDYLPPGYRWLEFYPDGRIKTGIKRTANYVGTFDEQAKGY